MLQKNAGTLSWKAVIAVKEKAQLRSAKALIFLFQVLNFYVSAFSSIGF